MKFKEVTAVFTAPDIVIAEELICDTFFSFDLKGVVCNVPIDEPDEGFGTQTLKPLNEYSVTGFLPLIDSTPVELARLEEKLSALSDLGIQVTPRIRTVDEEDWANAWKAYFKVTRITDRIVIKPEWQPYTASDSDIVIHLDPGMAFGTGTHPTTFMCLELIEQFITKESTFLDVGTGSGILMIAAGKLGARTLTGIDTDPVAIEIAARNLEKNQIPEEKISLSCATINQIDSEKTGSGHFDLIAANIIAQVIVDILPDIASLMHPQTTAILSGIIREHEAQVLETLEKCHLDVIKTDYTDEWVAIAVQKKKG